MVTALLKLFDCFRECGADDIDYLGAKENSYVDRKENGTISVKTCIVCTSMQTDKNEF